MVHQEGSTTNGTASMAAQTATTTGGAAILPIRPAAANITVPPDRPALTDHNTTRPTGQASDFDDPLWSPPPPYLAEPAGSEVSKVELMTDKPLYIRIVDVLRDTRSVAEQIIRNAAIVLPKLNPEKYKKNPNPHYEVVNMEVAAPPGGHPTARYALAADGEIVVEGPTYRHAKDALTWLLVETVRMVSKEAPRAWDRDVEAVPVPSARWAREV